MLHKRKHDVQFAKAAVRIVKEFQDLHEHYDGVCSGISTESEGKFHINPRAFKELRQAMIEEYGDRFPYKFYYHGAYESDRSECGYVVDARVGFDFDGVYFFCLDDLLEYEDECAGKIDWQECLAKGKEELSQMEDDD